MDRKGAPLPDNPPGFKSCHSTNSNITRQQQTSGSSTAGTRRSPGQTSHGTAPRMNTVQNEAKHNANTTGSHILNPGSKSRESGAGVAPGQLASINHDLGSLKSGDPKDAMEGLPGMAVAEASQSGANNGSRTDQTIDSPMQEETLVKELGGAICDVFRKVTRSELERHLGQMKEEQSRLSQEQSDIIRAAIPGAEELQEVTKANISLKRYNTRMKNQLAGLKQDFERLKGENNLRETAQRASKLKVENLLEELQQVRNDLDRSDRRLRDRAAQLYKWQTSNQRMQARLTEHEASKERNENQIRVLQTLSEELQAQNEKHKNTLRKTQQELLNLERAQRGIGWKYEKTSDSDLQSQWMQLDCHIRNLAHTLSEHAPAGGFIENSETSQRFRVIPRGDHEEILRDPSQSWLLVQAYLWRVAFQFIYPHDHELTPFIEIFEDVRLTLLVMEANDAPAMAAWFANRWQSVDKQYETDRDVHISASEEATLLAGFVPNGLRNNDAISRVQGSLRAILEKARDLCVAMGGSRAVFRRDWLNPTQDTCLHYDQESMEKANMRKAGCEVFFIISPQVVKHGTADGRDHGCQLTLAKAKVVLMETALEDDGEDSSCEDSNDEMALESDDDVMDAEFVSGEDSESN